MLECGTCHILDRANFELARVESPLGARRNPSWRAYVSGQIYARQDCTFLQNLEQPVEGDEQAGRVRSSR